jgi:MoxR-like ATPase
MSVNGTPIRLKKLSPAGAETEKVETHAYIPDEKYALNYVHRKVNGVGDFELLDRCFMMKWNLILSGDTGAGKTMLPMAYAAWNRIPYYSVPCDVSIDPRALFGKMMPTNEVGKFKWVDGPVTEIVRNGGVLNFSEVNSMPPRIAFSLFQLLDHRRSLTLLEHEGETIRLHGPDCWCGGGDGCKEKWVLVVADYNPKYRGTQELNAAFANRFQVKVSWGYLPEVEDSLVQSTELLSMVRSIRSSNEIRTPIGTNMMLEYIDIACTLGVDFATQNFVNAFSDSERDPVAKLMDVASENIKQDIAAIQSGKRPDDLMEEVPEDPSWYEDKEADPDDFEFEEV